MDSYLLELSVDSLTDYDLMRLANAIREGNREVQHFVMDQILHLSESGTFCPLLMHACVCVRL